MGLMDVIFGRALAAPTTKAKNNAAPSSTATTIAALEEQLVAAEARLSVIEATAQAVRSGGVASGTSEEQFGLALAEARADRDRIRQEIAVVKCTTPAARELAAGHDEAQRAYAEAHRALQADEIEMKARHRREIEDLEKRQGALHALAIRAKKSGAARRAIELAVPQSVRDAVDAAERTVRALEAQDVRDRRQEMQGARQLLVNFDKLVGKRSLSSDEKDERKRLEGVVAEAEAKHARAIQALEDAKVVAERARAMRDGVFQRLLAGPSATPAPAGKAS